MTCGKKPTTGPGSAPASRLVRTRLHMKRPRGRGTLFRLPIWEAAAAARTLEKMPLSPRISAAAAQAASESLLFYAQSLPMIVSAAAEMAASLFEPAAAAVLKE